MISKIESDYRKWILFNNQLSDFQKLYDLYTSVDQMVSKGEVQIEGDLESDSAIIISQGLYDTSVKLETENDRKQFLTYLKDHYLPNDEIEDWYQSKLRENDKKRNHFFDQPIKEVTSESFDFKIHPREQKYYRIRAFFSLVIYLLLVLFLVIQFIDSLMGGLVGLLVVLVIVGVFFAMKSIAQGFFVGIIKGSAVKLNRKQYSELYKIIEEQSTQIGLKKVPEVYIASGHFNAFVTKYARRKYLVLFSEVLETAARGDYDVVKFIVGHELGHLKRNHLTNQAWLFVSFFIPFLSNAHSRGCEYTCDRIGYHFSAKGAMEGILMLATGKEIFSKINIDQYVNDSYAENSFWVWMSEKFRTHPYTFKRMSAVREYAKRGY